MRTVLFVCVHNSGRSQMAEAFFNRLAGKGFRALSAGTRPGARVNPIVVQVMLEAGIDISDRKPKSLTPDMLDQADRVITMGCMDDALCPASLVETEDWALDDPEGKPIQEVRRIRDEIERRVLAMPKEEKHD